MDVLFLTASTGGGHLKAAEAVQEYIDIEYTDSRTLIVDTLKYISPIVDKLIVGSYLNTVRSTPNLYGMLYRRAETNESITDITKTFSHLMSSRLCSLIDSFQPSAIVCTHTLPVQMLSDLKRKNKVQIPLIAIVTDFVNHLFWKLDHVDAFVVAHEYIRQDMIRMGLDGKRIHTLGIPVSREFYRVPQRKTLLEEFGLIDMPTALIMGGSLGFGEIKGIFQALLNCQRDLQIIAVTGTNAKLKKQLESCAINSYRPVRIFSYTERIADLMEIADFLITKPGGLTVSEALTKRLPMFLISPIPGQEEKNARFLINSGVAVRIMPDDNIDSILCQTLDNPLRLKHMKEMAGYLAKPGAAEDIALLVESLSSGRRLSDTAQTVHV